MGASESTQSSLRDSKKQRTRSEILANAIALFRQKGIRETRTSEIAQRTEISAGTLFNYFPTKQALVEAWLRGELDEIVGAAVAEHGGRGLRPFVRRVCRDLAERGLNSPGLRAEGWRMLGRSRSDRFRIHRSAPLARVVLQEQGRERVRQDHAPEVLAEIVMDGLEGGLAAAVQSAHATDAHQSHQTDQADAASMRATSRALEARMDLILDGLRKRNERVAMASVKQSRQG